MQTFIILLGTSLILLEVSLCRASEACDVIDGGCLAGESKSNPIHIDDDDLSLLQSGALALASDQPSKRANGLALVSDESSKYDASVREHRVRQVPHFTIDLDKPPRERFKEPARYYREELLAMSTVLAEAIDGAVGEHRAEWLNAIRFSTNETKHWERIEEMKGIVEEADNTSMGLETQMLSQALYELASPTLCAAVLWALPNGTVMHGRNMDYALHFTMPDGTVKNWPDITFEYTMVRNGQPLIKGTGWPGSVGVHTAMRIGGWSFDQNTRPTNNITENLAAAKLGGVYMGQPSASSWKLSPTFRKLWTKPMLRISWHPTIS